MRLVAYENAAGRWFGVERGGDRVVPLCPLEEFYRDPGGWLGAGPAPSQVALPRDGLRLVPPVPATARVFCVAFNYPAPASEPPGAPTVFGRWTSSLAVHGEHIPCPAADDLDWEGELAAVVGWPTGPGTGRPTADAVVAYSVFNDLTARRHQMATSQWTLGKNVDRSGPVGPVLVTADEVGDPCAPPGRLLETRVNGELVQQANTADMVFTVGAVIDYIAGIVPLAAGDLVAMGTPDGVGHFRHPPRYLRPGDAVEVSIAGIGTLRNQIVAPTTYSDDGPRPEPRVPRRL